MAKRSAILKLGLANIKNDNESYIFKHLRSTTTCFDSSISLSFKIVDKANSKFDLKLKKLD